MNNYLIIGASGCIGFETAKWLLSNKPEDKVITLSRGKTVYPGELKNCFQEIGDISSKESILKAIQKHKVSHVLHCAALRTSDCNEAPERAQKINVGGTKNVIEACEASGLVKEFVFLSTAAVYDQVDNQVENITEDSPVKKYAPYVATKLESEEFIQEFSKNSAIAFTIVRPQILFGPSRSQSGSTAGVTKCIQAIAFNKKYTIPYSGQYSFHFTGDTGQLIGTVLTAEKSYSCETFNLPGNSYKVNDFMDLLNNLTFPNKLISMTVKQYPFAKSANYEKYTKFFGEINLTPLKSALSLTLKQFKNNRL